MTKETRIAEISSPITALSETAYYQNELKEQYKALERQVTEITYNDIHVRNANLDLRDVMRHLSEMNEKYGHPDDILFEKVIADCRKISTEIKAIKSGDRGEDRAFKCLETILCKKRILTNLELKYGEHKTEIDAVVITSKAVFIIEVKNPSVDIYIDERGNFYRDPSRIRFDSNIGVQMNEKQYLVKQALENGGYKDVKVVSYVVFTNTSKEIKNDYEFITTCYVSNLPNYINNYKADKSYAESDIEKMSEILSRAEIKEKYSPKIDIKEFKVNFATLIATLEEASGKYITNDDKETCETDILINDDKPNTQECDDKGKVICFIPRILKSVGLLGLGIAAGFIVGRKNNLKI